MKGRHIYCYFSVFFPRSLSGYRFFFSFSFLGGLGVAVGGSSGEMIEARMQLQDTIFVDHIAIKE